jgi:hypothetical protein
MSYITKFITDLITTGALGGNDLQLTLSPTVPGHVEGRLYYDSVWKTLSTDINTDVTLQIGQEELAMVYNATAAIIYNGQPVYVNGVYSAGSNNVPTVDYAYATTFATADVFGVATQDIPPSSYGLVCVRGNVNGLNTNQLGAAYLSTQGMILFAQVGGLGGNAYTFTVIQTAGALSYSRAGNDITIDIGVGGATAAQVVAEIMLHVADGYIIAVPTTPAFNVLPAAVLPFANGAVTTVGDVLYLSEVGGFTTVKPTLPNLVVRVGRLVTKSATVGRINIRISQSYRLGDLSDVVTSSLIDGDRLTWDAATTSWINDPAAFSQYELLADIKTANSTQDRLGFCLETSSMYRYETDGTAPIDYGATDDKYVLITGDGGVTRWIGCDGLYNYAQKAATFITNRLVAGTESTPRVINAPTVLTSTVGSQLFLDVTGADRAITLPAVGDSYQSQYLNITVISTSAKKAVIQTTNTNLSQTITIAPNESAFFIFGQTKWHLIGGKQAVTQLAQDGISTYKTISDWNNIVQSGGIITGGLCTDNGLGGINISAMTAIAKVTTSDTADNVFIDMPGDSILTGALTDNSINYIFFDYNGGAPFYDVETVRSNVARTDQFIIAQLFKNGLDLEIVNLESGISNFSRKVVDRLIEVNGVNRISGAVVSESGTRSLQTTSGVMYYGLERIITPPKNTNVTDFFDVYFRNGTGGWNLVENETVIDRLRFDDNDIPVAVGGAITGVFAYWIYADNAAAVDIGGGIVQIPCTDHNFHKGDTVVISVTTNYNGTYTVRDCGVNSFNITAAYVAEVFAATTSVVTGLMLVVTTGAHGLVDDDYVYISGSSVADGYWKVTKQTNTEITLNHSASLAGAGGGTVDSLPLVNLAGGGTYGVHWIFICTEGELYVVYGQADYANLAAAQAATLPATLPPYIGMNCVAAAKIIVEPATANFTEVQSAYTVQFATTTPALHNDLAGLDGGVAGEYYHLTAAEHAAMAGGITTGAVNKVGLYSTSPTGKVISDSVLDNDASHSASIAIAPQTLVSTRTYTVPDTGANASFIMSELAQTLNGLKYFTAGVKTPFAFPNADGTTAIQIRKADGATPIVNIDTTNHVLSLIGTGASTLTTGLKLNTYDTINAYIQNNIQNLSNGAAASSDWIATADNGNDTTNYIDMGINSSGWADAGWTINGVDAGYLYTSDGELAIGTANAISKAIRFFTGGTLLANQKAVILGDGHCGIGAITPSAWLQLRASGATTAGTAPLKFTSGLALATPEAGAVEYNGDFHATNNNVRMALGGVLYVDTADHTGAAGTVEQTLGTYTLPAGTLDVNNESVEIYAAFSITGAANSTVRIRFGGLAGNVVYQSETANRTGDSIMITARIYRTGAATQKATAMANDQLGDLTVRGYYSAPTQTLANALAIVATGQNATDGSRVTLRTLEIRHFGAPA